MRPIELLALSYVNIKTEKETYYFHCNIDKTSADHKLRFLWHVGVNKTWYKRDCFFFCFFYAIISHFLSGIGRFGWKICSALRSKLGKCTFTNSYWQVEGNCSEMDHFLKFEKRKIKSDDISMGYLSLELIYSSVFMYWRARVVFDNK